MFTIYMFTKTSHAVHALSSRQQAIGAMENCRASDHVYMALLYDDNNLIDAYINKAPVRSAQINREVNTPPSNVTIQSPSGADYTGPLPVNTPSTTPPNEIDATPRAHYGDDYDDIPF